MTKKSISRQIATLRQDHGITQAELASQMGVSVRTVSGWETGDRPPKYGERLLEEMKQVLGSKTIAEESTAVQPSNNEREMEMLKDKLIAVMEEKDELRKEVAELKAMLAEQVLAKSKPLARKKMGQ